MGDGRRALIVAAAAGAQLDGIPERPAVVIAADSGLHAVLERGWVPDHVVGDLDSARPDAVATALDGGASVDQHPESKNETDLELALGAARDAGATDIHVVVRADGRLDHQLANLIALANPAWRDAVVSASIGEHAVWVVRGTCRLELDRGQHLALVPIAGPATVTSSGVAYPLDREVLSPFEARGIANEVVAEIVEIDVSDGVVLVLSSPPS